MCEVATICNVAKLNLDIAVTAFAGKLSLHLYINFERYHGMNVDVEICIILVNC